MMTSKEKKANGRTARNHLRLSKAQASALECRDLSGTIIDELWDGHRRLMLPDGSKIERLLDELIEAANGEDADAEQNTDPSMRKFARRAANSLSIISDHVVKGARG